MAKPPSAISTKRIQIDKAQANMVLIIAAASFIAIFSLVASRALLVKRGFQSRVIAEKETTLQTLKKNNEAVEQLKTSYKAFNSSSDNLLGGNPSGTGDRDGDNARLVLDALPATYDFPALASSMERIVGVSGGASLKSITGTDDQVAQSQQTDSSTAIEVPFDLAIDAKTDSYNRLLQSFSKSIRPMTIHSLKLTPDDKGEMTMAISGKTYYLPKKTLSIGQKEVR